MPQDALNSFRSLSTKIPVWIASLDTILDNATQRQNELLFANQPADSDETLVRKNSQSSSPRSKKSKHEDVAAETAEIDPIGQPTATPVPTLLRPQLPHMTDSDALRLSQRKRKTFSACSGDQSGPSKYRSRALVVVYYDGDVQKRFTELVQGVCASRNDIRRSKLSAKVGNFSRSRSSSSGSDNISIGNVGEETTKSIGTFTYKATRLRLQDLSAASRPNSSEALNKVDELLERSQTLCEHAAHQVLRDGDCALEVKQAKDLLEQAKACAEREMPGLEEIAAADQQRQLRSDEKQRMAKQPPPQPADSEKIELLAREPSSDPLEVNEIEVDDEDDSDTELDMAALKLPPNLAKYTMRSTRLTAC